MVNAVRSREGGTEITKKRVVGIGFSDPIQEIFLMKTGVRPNTIFCHVFTTPFNSRLLFILGFLLMFLVSKAQRPCGTVEYNDQIKTESKNRWTKQIAIGN